VLRHTKQMKIAIIGTGISGLGAAYLLAPEHDITLYEKNACVGGHSRTIDVAMGDKTAPVDTGFIVFNNWNYPNLLGLFKQLNVPFQKSEMSFGVSVDKGWLEYGSGGMFAQKLNFLRPAYYKMLADIVRFNKQAPAYIEKNTDISLQYCLDEMKMGTWFRRYYLLAMGAAIWSCPIETIMQFPAQTFLRFFKNHGLLSINNRPQWYTVTGGSREYTSRLSAALTDKIKLECGAHSVRRQDNGITITDTQGSIETFDQVIFACHADEALNMIEAPSEQTSQILGAFDYQDNHVVTHSDTSFMPQHKKCWSSWVYLSETREDKKQSVSLSYWMNNLQSLDPDYPVLVTLNPGRRPREESIMDEHVFSHPIFDLKAIKAQEKIKDIQGKDGLWFCGAYQRYGFHEDGLLSAVNVAKSMGARIPWE
jgi:predicted NAD/FAD-binding protein